jgi:hypothetical protein
MHPFGPGCGVRMTVSPDPGCSVRRARLPSAGYTLHLAAQRHRGQGNRAAAPRPLAQALAEVRLRHRRVHPALRGLLVGACSACKLEWDRPRRGQVF